MSRETQYIGLNQLALDWIEEHAISEEMIQIGEGMFDEPIMGKQWRIKPPDGPNKDCVATEKVQCVPWSSGPMIFTCIAITVTKDCGQICEDSEYFKWMHKPWPYVAEYNREKGWICT